MATAELILPEQPAEYFPIVRRLMDYIEENKLQSDFAAAVEKAHSYNIEELAVLEISSVESFFQYINRLLRWVPVETFDGKGIYYHIVLFYFVFNQPPFKKEQTPIRPQQAGHLSWFSRWLVDYAVEVGKFLDTPESLTEKSLATFRRTPSYNMDQYLEPRGGWKTFNEFFARNFKPGYRTIYGLNDPTVLVSPADCTYGGAWHVDASSLVTIKHIQWSVSELLSGSPYADAFYGGTFTHSFLNTFDYHRQHTPVSGKVLEARVIQGQAYLETKVISESTEGGKKKLSLDRSVDAPDSPGYQFVQMRGLIVVDSPIGLVAILPIGMAQVSSVVVTAEVGVSLRKGEEISYFQFGGSDIVLVFQKDSKVELTAVRGTHYSVGSQVGTAKVQP